MSALRRSTQTRDADGFTLMEMTIAITITAVAFLAIASVMGAAVKTLALQKARTQGNEVATQGIEDLQRYSFTNLALCGPPVDVATPSDLVDPVVTTSTLCPSGGVDPAASKATFGDFPCAATATTATQKGIPRAFYNCSRINVTYNVRRYVAWTDAGRTAKRLAVYVDWTDQLGKHTVSQQSSLRSPATGDIVGIQAPGFAASTPSSINPVVSKHDNAIDGAGLLESAITLNVRTTGLTNRANDRVFVSFTTLAPNNDLTTSTLALTPFPNNDSWDKATWTGTIPAFGTLRYPVGTQFLTFSAVRAADGKTGSLVDTTTVDTLTVSRFCPSTGCPTVTQGFPEIGTVSVQQGGTSPPAAGTVHIDAGGALRNVVSFRATTKGLVATDGVTLQFMTKSGAFNTSMKADTSNGKTCDASTCEWLVQVLPSSGISFNSGTQKALVTASQLTADSSRSTAAAQSGDITFAVVTT